MVAGRKTRGRQGQALVVLVAQSRPGGLVRRSLSEWACSRRCGRRSRLSSMSSPGFRALLRRGTRSLQRRCRPRALIIIAWGLWVAPLARLPLLGHLLPEIDNAPMRLIRCVSGTRWRLFHLHVPLAPFKAHANLGRSARDHLAHCRPKSVRSCWPYVGRMVAGGFIGRWAVCGIYLWIRAGSSESAIPRRTQAARSG